MTATELQKQTSHETTKPHEEIHHWKYMHPMLGIYTYKNLSEPSNLSDAHCRMIMHRNAVEDIDIQIQIAEVNHSIFTSNYVHDYEGIDSQKYDLKQKKHLDKIVILLNSKLQHKRKANAYWYWMQCHDSTIENQINTDVAEVLNG